MRFPMGWYGSENGSRRRGVCNMLERHVLQTLEERQLLSAISISPEFKINTDDIGNQTDFDSAMNLTGKSVVVWDSDQFRGVRAQQYGPNGEKVGEEIHVNTNTFTNDQVPAVAIDSAGDFVVVWERNGQDSTNNWGINGQRFDATGAPVGNEFRVNTTTAGNQRTPKVAMDSNGDFVVTWTSTGQDGDGDGIYAQRFDASGIPVGNEFRVNTTTASDQKVPTVAMDPQGNFVIGWVSQKAANDFTNTNLVAQRYDVSGIPQEGEFIVNSISVGWQYEPVVTINPAGDFVFAWNHINYGDNDTVGGVFGRQYSAAGIPLANQFRVDDPDTAVFIFDGPGVSIDANGNVGFAWSAVSTVHGVAARRYTSSGQPMETPFQVSLPVTNTTDVSNARIGMDTAGDFLVTWGKGQISDGTINKDWAGFGHFYANHSDFVGTRRGATFYLDANHSDRFENAVNDFAGVYGNSTDLTVIGDWNKDGFDEIGIWRSGYFYLDTNGNGKWDGAINDSYFRYGNFGAAGDLPLAGDWDGDGKDEIGVWSQGKFYLDLNGNHVQDAGDGVYAFGAVNDTPLIGDWNGDGIDDVGTWRAGRFYEDKDGNHKWNAAVDKVFAFGATTDIPVVGDWNGDQQDEIGIRRGNTFWLDNNGNGAWSGTGPGADQQIRFGNAGDTPAVGHWRPKELAPPNLSAMNVSGVSLPASDSTADADTKPENSQDPLANAVAPQGKKQVTRDQGAETSGAGRRASHRGKKGLRV